MRTPNTFNGLFGSVRDSVPYKVEKAIIEFTEHVSARMAVLKVSRSELAKRLNTSPAYVTKLLSGGTNFTLESMVKILHALEAELKFELAQSEPGSNWKMLAEKAVAARKPKGLQAYWQRQDRERNHYLSDAKRANFSPLELYPE